MTTALRLLIIEDSEDDALLIVRDLQRAGYEPIYERVENEATVRAALDRGPWDVIISDFNMPAFSGTEALRVLRARDRETPFIFVSGTIGEDVAVEAMRAGAQDYVTKGNLRRLVPAIERELREAAGRRASEARYQLLFAQHPSPLWVFDRETLRFLEVNEAAERQYGYTREEFLGMTIEAIRPAEDVSLLRGDLRREPLGLHHAGVWRHRKKDGSVIDVEVTAHDVVFLDRPGRLVTAVDVTERTRAEAALRAREREQAAIARLGERAITTTDLSDLFEGAVALVGDTLDVPYCQVLELQADGRSLLLRAGVGWREGSVGQAIVDASQAGHTLQLHEPVVVEDWRTETRFRSADLLRSHAIVSGVTVQIPTKARPFGVLGAHDDRPRKFTRDDIHFLQAVAHILGTAIDRNRAETATLQSQRLESVGRLAGGVAHDFNNLLTAIMGYSELVLEELPPGDRMREDVEEIRKAAARAGALTQQLLAFSRRQVLETKPLDLNDVVADMEKMLRRLIGEDIALETALQPDLGTVKADPGQIEQVIVNLVVNARDAMPQGGKITLETANVVLDGTYADQHIAVTPGRYVMLAVTDTGIGMDRETQARIFEPFFTTKGPERGTGLGLATVYGIVKQSGGNIWVYSEPAHGTTFKIYLPVVDEDAIATPTSGNAPRTVNGTETVLLAEDEEVVRRLTERILLQAGYRVLVATTGAEALALSESHDGPIHLLISDVVMPQMSGGELGRRLAAARPSVRILYLSGYTDPRIVQQGLLEGGAAFLQKPFWAEALVRKVREVLDNGT
jgi:PAS domain S-box-containing protein